MNSADRKKERIKLYNINPSKCVRCGAIIEYDRRTKKYCNRVCMGKDLAQKRLKAGNFNHCISRKRNRIENDKHIATVTPYVKHLLEDFYKKDISELVDKDIENYKDFLTKCIWEHDMSVNDIIRAYHPNEYNQQFYKCLKKRLKIKLRNRNEKKDLLTKKHKGNKEKSKQLYWQRCKFKFDVYKEKKIKGWYLLHIGSFNKEDNIFLNRDHRYSIYDGWINNVDPYIISHPMNCEILISSDNFSKSRHSSITLEELLLLIKDWDQDN